MDSPLGSPYLKTLFSAVLTQEQALLSMAVVCSLPVKPDRSTV